MCFSGGFFFSLNCRLFYITVWVSTIHLLFDSHNSRQIPLITTVTAAAPNRILNGANIFAHKYTWTLCFLSLFLRFLCCDFPFGVILIELRHLLYLMRQNEFSIWIWINLNRRYAREKTKSASCNCMSYDNKMSQSIVPINRNASK